jgi:hypothetical protein
MGDAAYAAKPSARMRAPALEHFQAKRHRLAARKMRSKEWH